MPKFPRLIHVTREAAEHGPSWLDVHVDGVASLDVPNQEVAIYQLVKVGRVTIQKAFRDRPSNRPKRAPQ